MHKIRCNAKEDSGNSSVIQFSMRLTPLFYTILKRVRFCIAFNFQKHQEENVQKLELTLCFWR